MMRTLIPGTLAVLSAYPDPPFDVMKDGDAPWRRCYVVMETGARVPQCPDNARHKSIMSRKLGRYGYFLSPVLSGHVGSLFLISSDASFPLMTKLL